MGAIGFLLSILNSPIHYDDYLSVISQFLSSLSKDKKVNTFFFENNFFTFLLFFSAFVSKYMKTLYRGNKCKI